MPSTADWHSKWTTFSVPAFGYPGADARNIQVAAHCSRLGFAYFGENECQRAAEQLHAVQPGASVPVLNYPSHWPRLYAALGDDSENFFMKFWRGNAVILLVGVMILAYKINYRLFPFLIFSPITLLAIERGNIDAITFSVVFVPLMFTASELIGSFFLGIAVALKVFPALGYVGFIRKRRLLVGGGLLVGLILAAPAYIPSLVELPFLLGGTSKGFSIAYGLLSVKHLKYISAASPLANMAPLILLVCIAGAFFGLWLNKNYKKDIGLELKALSSIDLLLLSISLSIFLGTFFVFVNWAYRLIFLIPAFLVLSHAQHRILKFIFWNIFFILWAPILPFGWALQNIACFSLAPPSLCVLIYAIEMRTLRLANDPAGAEKVRLKFAGGK